MGPAVNILSALTCMACAYLLLRGYMRSHVRLLLWSGLCFIALAVNSGMIFVDEVIVPNTDLSLVQLSTGLIGIALLLYGLIWEAE